MSEHPLDVLETACSLSQTNLDWPAALRAVEQLEQAARNLDGYANDESGPYVLVRLDELSALTAALALFDRKEQTP